MKNINICIAGLGNVGSHVINSIIENSQSIESKSSINFNILGISAKNKSKKRIFDLNLYQWFDNPLDFIKLKNCDVIIELIGDEGGLSLDLVKSALLNKINVITANKALLAKNGNELFDIAEENNVLLLYEAAVAGGIPIIKTLKNNIFLNKIKKISGILNGTTNYILTEMDKKKSNFSDILSLAKSKGFTNDSESKLDIGGLDSAHKLTILSTLCYGSDINFENNHIEGIYDINIEDIINADKLGYKIKLISESYISDNQIYSVTGPKLIHNTNPLANVDGALNAIKIETDHLNSLFLEGEGAGGRATASSVLSDLYEISSNSNISSLGYSTKKLKKFTKIDLNEIKTSYYIRIMTEDTMGVLSKITGYLETFNISIKKIIQLPDLNKKNIPIPIIIFTHEILKEELKNAIKKIQNQKFVLKQITIIPIDQS